MAIIILGVLLVLGMVFIGIVNRNIVGSGRMQTRSVANNLAEAGVRYAHQQLLNNSADWRPAQTVLAGTAGDITRDPDALYLRPGTGFGWRGPTDANLDQGGPDGLGSYSRINVDKGRYLVRVRYAPSDLNAFNTSAIGSLRTPGKAKSYTIIESIGRPGTVNVNDPTTLPSGGGVQFQNYANDGAFRAAIEKMKDRDNQFVNSRKLMAFASIGIIDHAIYITNKYESDQPIELGAGENIDVSYNANPVLPIPTVGGAQRVYEPYDPVAGGSPTWHTDYMAGGGSVYINGDVIVHNIYEVLLNKPMGDSFSVAGVVTSADTTSTLRFRVSDIAGGTWQETLINRSGSQIDSRSDQFSTLGGLFRDTMAKTDSNDDARGVSRLEPPSILRTDPETGLNKYLTWCRDSGKILDAGNSGRFGQGKNVYVNNDYDRQMRYDADGRADVGSAESLVYDWLNPNNGQQGTGWKGPYYIPPGASLTLLQDGFIITRDGSHRPAGAPDNQRTWRRPDGTDSGLSTLRYKLGKVGGRTYIVNNLTPGVGDISGVPNYSAGVPFDGILFFEGNVRVRGVIPTDEQISVVSMGTIYIEGSITKGIFQGATRINRPSLSTIMLMAKDYVALNPSMFFGPSTNQQVDEFNESTTTNSWNPVRLAADDGTLRTQVEFLVDPNTGTAGDPSSFMSYIESYRQFSDPDNNSGTPIDTHMVITHTMEDGKGAYAFLALDVDYGLPDPTYLFELTENNSATPLYPDPYTTPGYSTAGYAPNYGLGSHGWQRYGNFESMGTRLFSASSLNSTDATMTSTGPEGRFTVQFQESSEITFRTTNMALGATNDYLLSRFAIIPHNVRIDASIYAEEGSFFVIPGNWFNPQASDTRKAWVDSASTDDERNEIRLDKFGSSPWTPFYGEPIDVQITLYGSVSQNMPPTLAQNAEILKKWGWIPRRLGATDQLIPWSHVPEGYNISNSGSDEWVPNITIIYDPVLATGRQRGYDISAPYIRIDEAGRPLPPMPRLPVSPTLSYFGEVNP